MERMAVAKFHNTPIQIVEDQWCYSDYLDRREYMDIHNAVMERLDSE